MMTKDIMQCTSDMLAIGDGGKFTLQAQVRAFDLLEKITDLPEGDVVGPADVYSDTVATWCSALGPAEEFCRNASEYTTVNGGKPWKYVLLAHDKVDRTSSFDYLVAVG